VIYNELLQSCVVFTVMYVLRDVELLQLMLVLCYCSLLSSVCYTRVSDVPLNDIIDITDSLYIHVV